MMHSTLVRTVVLAFFLLTTIAMVAVRAASPLSDSVSPTTLLATTQPTSASGVDAWATDPDNQNVIAAPSISASYIDSYLASKGSPLSGYGAAFVTSGKNHGVDPRLIVAIAGAESTFGKTRCQSWSAADIHNAWGYMYWPNGIQTCRSFANWEEGIETVSWQIGSSALYFKDGLVTIAQIGARYCGSGPECTTWVPNVTTFYTEMGGNVNDLAFAGLPSNYYLPFGVISGGLRVSRTGLLYRPEYEAAGLTFYNSSEYHPGDNRAAIDFSGVFDVRAAADGTVTESNVCQVVIKSGNDTVYYIHHSHQIKVSAGASVKRGDVIAVTGGFADCNADGAHLHFAIWRNGVEQPVYFQDAPTQTSNGYTCPAGLICPSKGGYVEFRYSGGSVPDYIPFGANARLHQYFNTKTYLNATVCADNLPGHTVYLHAWRDNRSFDLSLDAGGNRCVTFRDIDGSGDVFDDRPYKIWVSLNKSPDANWPVHCLDSTNRLGMCTEAQFPTTDVDPPGSYISFGANARLRQYFDTKEYLNAEVCADNLPGHTVYLRAWRDNRYFDLSLDAGGNRCITFGDIDGAGTVFEDRPYRIWVSMNKPSDVNWPIHCLGSTNRNGMCTQAQYPSTDDDPPPLIPTFTPTPTDTKTPTPTPTFTLTPTATKTPTSTATNTPTPTGSATPTATPTLTPSLTPGTQAIIRAGSASVIPNATVIIPVEILHVPAPGLAAATIEMRYDPAILNATACVVNQSAGFTGVCNPAYASGIVRFNVAAPMGVSGDALLASITFQVIGDSGTLSDLDVLSLVFIDSTGKSIPVTPEDGRVRVGLRGDVNCDDAVNVVDGLFVLQYDVGLRAAGQQCPPPVGRLYTPSCDVNNDNACNVVDGLFILQCDVGIHNVFCPASGLRSDFEAPRASHKVTQFSGALLTVGSGQVTPGGSLVLPITSDLSETLLAAGTIDVRYDPAIVNAIACVPDPDGAFDFEQCNVNYDHDGVYPDTVRFNVIAFTGVTGTLHLANVTFQAVSGPGTSSALDGIVVAFTDPDGESLSVTDQDGTICITPCGPTATNTPTATATATQTPTVTPTGTATSTPTETVTPTTTPTETATTTPTPTETVTVTATPTPTETATATPGPSATPTSTPTPTPTSYRVADLGVMVTDSMDPVTSGLTFQYVVTATSTGLAFGTEIRGTLSSGGEVMFTGTYTASSDYPGWRCDVAGSDFICNTGWFVGSEVLVFDATVNRSASAGQIQFCTGISASFQPGGGHDPNPDNNWNCANTTVLTWTPTRTVTATPTPIETTTATPTPTATTTDMPTPTSTATVTPTATGTVTPTPTSTPSCSERVANGGFEANSVWTFTVTGSTAGYTTAQAHSGARAARFGILPVGLAANDVSKVVTLAPGAPEQNLIGEVAPLAGSFSSGYQTISIPADAANATLTFWYYPATDAVSGDFARVLLLQPGTYAVIQTVMQRLENDRAWKPASFDLSAYRGRSVVLYFEVFNDSTTGAGRTWMYLDDVSVLACSSVLPTYTPTPTATASATVTRTPTPTATSTGTATSTATPTATATVTSTSTSTNTPSATPTATPTVTPTVTATPTATNTPLATPTPTSTPAGVAQVLLMPAVKRTDFAAGAFTVDLVVEGVTNLASFQTDLLYDPAIISVNALSLGAFLGSTGRTATLVGPKIDNTAGKVTFGAFSFGTQPGAAGAGMLATIAFQPRATGMTALRLQATGLSDPIGSAISVTTTDGQVQIAGCFGDFNGDNKVDIFDLQRAASHWNCRTGQSCYDAQYDTEPDGDIDVFDLQRFAAAWGSRCDLPAAQQPAWAVRRSAELSEATAAASLSLLPADKRIAPAGVFTETVHLQDGADVAAFQTTLRYNPTVAQVESVTLGSLLGGTGRTVIPVGPTIDNATGQTTFGAFTFGSQGGVSGAGDLAYVRFRAQQKGQMTVSFQETAVSDPQGNTLPPGDLRGAEIIVDTPTVYLPLLIRQ